MVDLRRSPGFLRGFYKDYRLLKASLNIACVWYFVME